MIRTTVSEDTFSERMNAHDLEAYLDQYLDPSWHCCTPEKLLRESLKFFNMTKYNIRKGIDNLQVPPFIIGSQTITLYISNRHTVCGKKQMLYFFLEYIITGKIIKETDNYLFTVDQYGSVIPQIQESNRNYKMTENQGLNANAETLLGILSHGKK